MMHCELGIILGFLLFMFVQLNQRLNNIEKSNQKATKKPEDTRG